jgi:hypothetical protein
LRTAGGIGCQACLPASWLSLSPLSGLRSWTHPDTFQYHLALPRLFLQAGRYQFIPTNASSGLYLGYDIFNVLFPWIAANPLVTFPIKVFNGLVGSLFFLSVFVVIKRFSRLEVTPWLALAVLFSTETATRWVDGKNDFPAAAAALIYIALATRVERRDWRTSSFLGCLAGWAVAVKITNAIFVGVFFLMDALSRRSIRNGLFFLVGVVLVVGPWVAFVWITRGNPFFPFMENPPEYIKHAWEVRGANGLRLGWRAFFENFVPLLLNKGRLISGGDSVGFPFLLSLVLAVGVWLPLLSRLARFRPIVLTGISVLLLLMVKEFEQRFLIRYVFASIGVVVAAGALVFEHLLHRVPRVIYSIIAGIAGLVIVFTGPVFSSMKTELLDGRDRGQFLSGKIGLPEYYAGRWSKVYMEAAQYVNSHARREDVIAVTDGMTYHFDIPSLNIHPLHSTYLRYDQLSPQEYNARLTDAGIRFVLIRTNGVHALTQQFVDTQADLIVSGEGITLYKVR